MATSSTANTNPRRRQPPIRRGRRSRPPAGERAEAEAEAGGARGADSDDHKGKDSNEEQMKDDDNKNKDEENAEEEYGEDVVIGRIAPGLSVFPVINIVYSSSCSLTNTINAAATAAGQARATLFSTPRNGP